MGDSGCLGDGCEEPDGEGNKYMIDSLLWFYLIGWSITAVIHAAALICREGRGRWWCIMSKVFFLAGTWPIWFFIFMTILTPLCLFRLKYVKERNAASSLRYLRRYPDGTRWLKLGWLIVLRARHQRFLARPTKGWMGTFSGHRGGKQSWRTRKLQPLPIEKHYFSWMASASDHLCDTAFKLPSSLGVLEEGQLDKDFVWAVETVVELQEDGLFRHIVTYV